MTSVSFIQWHSTKKLAVWRRNIETPCTREQLPCVHKTSLKPISLQGLIICIFTNDKCDGQQTYFVNITDVNGIIVIILFYFLHQTRKSKYVTNNNDSRLDTTILTIVSWSFSGCRKHKPLLTKLGLCGNIVIQVSVDATVWLNPWFRTCRTSSAFLLGFELPWKQRNAFECPCVDACAVKAGCTSVEHNIPHSQNTLQRRNGYHAKKIQILRCSACGGTPSSEHCVSKHYDTDVDRAQWQRGASCKSYPMRDDIIRGVRQRLYSWSCLVNCE